MRDEAPPEGALSLSWDMAGTGPRSHNLSRLATVGPEGRHESESPGRLVGRAVVAEDQRSPYPGHGERAFTILNDVRAAQLPDVVETQLRFSAAQPEFAAPWPFVPESNLDRAVYRQRVRRAVLSSDTFRGAIGARGKVLAIAGVV